MLALRALPLMVLVAALALAADPPKRVPAKLTPAADTTVALGPVEPDGRIDYEAALNERLRGRITPDDNAVCLLFTAVGPKPEGADLHPDFYKWLGRPAPEPPAAGVAYFVRTGDFFLESHGEGSEKFYEHYGELQKRPWTAKEEPRFAAWLEANEKPLLALTDAARRAEYYYPLISRPRDGTRPRLSGALLPLVQRYRELVPVLCLRAMRHCADGKPDAACADVLAAHRLVRLVARGGTLIELLVGVAIDAIARTTSLAVVEYGNLTVKQLMKFRDDLAGLPPMPRLADKLALGERYMFLDVMQAIRVEGYVALDADGLGVPAPAVGPEVSDPVLAKLDWESMLRLANRWYEKLEVSLRKPTRAERVKALDEFEKELIKLTEGTDLTKMFKEFKPDAAARTGEAVAGAVVRGLMPAVQKVSEAADRQEVHHRTLLVAVALAAYRREYAEFPEKLTDLVPAQLPKLPDDVFSGKPLIYKRTATGYELYSVGPNGKDDGCTLITDTPRGDDLGVRMPSKKQ